MRQTAVGKRALLLHGSWSYLFNSRFDLRMCAYIKHTTYVREEQCYI